MSERTRREINSTLLSMRGIVDVLAPEERERLFGERRPSMNTENYGSLEACQRLVDARTVLETEAVWAMFIKPELVNKRNFMLRYFNVPSIPAPSMAEVWRELPPTELHKDTLGMTCVSSPHKTAYFTNPADALIDLLIWVMEQEKGA